MKKLIISVSLSAVVMFGLPALIALIADGNMIMLYSVVDFYIISPLFSVFIGIFTGKQFKKLWYVPIISAALFLISAWIFLDFGDTAFVIYSCGYLAAGMISAFLTFLVSNSRKENN